MNGNASSRCALLLAVAEPERTQWHAQLRALAPHRDLRLWPDRIGDPSAIAYACVWNPPAGLLNGFINLKAIFSLGAGVDHLLADPALPHLPIVRIVDPDLTQRMTEYVVLNVLMHHRRSSLYKAQQAARRWREHPQPAASAVGVGIMGLGVLGRDAAEVLARLGFRVAGLSRTGKTVPGIETFSGEQRDAFLARTEILVCLLPLTTATRGILGLPLLRRLKRDGPLGGAYLVNAGRGGLQIEADLLAALREGTLAGASLDVFATEPLPQESPLWHHPQVSITPHIAAVSDPRALVPNVLAQIERFEQGLPLKNRVDHGFGY
jgi:glyoxylate/hydroxypyruvate reductase A